MFFGVFFYFLTDFDVIERAWAWGVLSPMTAGSVGAHSDAAADINKSSKLLKIDENRAKSAKNGQQMAHRTQKTKKA